VCGVDAAKK